MCQPATCPQCGKTTWTGCGQHVDEVMVDVRPEDRCSGHEEPTAPTAPQPGFFSRVFGR